MPRAQIRGAPGIFPMCRAGPLSQAGAMDTSTTGAEAAAETGQPAPAASRWPAMGTVTAYAAAIVAFAYALMSAYWALGGHALISTIGGYVEQFARQAGALPVLAAHFAGHVERPFITAMYTGRRPGRNG